MRTTLGAPPSLPAGYARAAVAALPVAGRLLRRGGDELPDSTYSLAEQRVDAERLAAYERVCGFRTSQVLPPTYLHVLAFPVTVALMTEPGFPVPLVGLVHVANSITVHRPVSAGEAVGFDVRAADLRPHPAGRQLDLVVSASVAGRPVWSSRSTYLHRGRPDEDVRDRPKRAPGPAPAAPAALVRVPADVGRRYGAVAGDRNPIHLYPWSARLFGFPAAIAHGMWLAARTLASLEGRLPGACTVDVSFQTPVLLPSTVAIVAVREGDGWRLDVRDAGTGKPHLRGTVRP